MTYEDLVNKYGLKHYWRCMKFASEHCTCGLDGDLEAVRKESLGE